MVRGASASRAKGPINSAASKIDTNEYGAVDESEFEASHQIVQTMLNLPTPTPRPVADPFDRINADGNGTLDATEIQTLLDGLFRMTGNTSLSTDIMVEVFSTVFG